MGDESPSISLRTGPSTSLRTGFDGLRANGRMKKGAGPTSGDILTRILAAKVKEVASARATKPLAALRDEARTGPPVRDFSSALRD